MLTTILLSLQTFAFASKSSIVDLVASDLNLDTLLGTEELTDMLQTKEHALPSNLASIPYPNVGTTFNLPAGFGPMDFALQNPCKTIEWMGAAFKNASAEDKCLSAKASISFQQVADLAGFDIGSISSALPKFLGFTKEKIASTAIHSIAVKFKFDGNKPIFNAIAFNVSIWNITLPAVAGIAVKLSATTLKFVSDGEFGLNGQLGVEGTEVAIPYQTSGSWQTPAKSLSIACQPPAEVNLGLFAKVFGISVLLTPIKLVGFEGIANLYVSSLELKTSEDGTNFTNAKVSVSMPGKVAFSLVSAQDPTVDFQVQWPFSSVNRTLTSISLKSSFTILNLPAYTFDGTAVYVLDPPSLELTQTFKDTFTFTNPLGVTGLTFKPVSTGLKIYREKADAPQQVDVTASAVLTFKDMFGPVSKYFPTEISGTMTQTHKDGVVPDNYSFDAKFLMTGCVFGPVTILDWKVGFKTDGKNFTLSGLINTEINIGAKLAVSVGAEFVTATKILTLTWSAPQTGANDWIQILPGAGLGNTKLTAVIDTSISLVKSISFEGTFVTKEAKLGPLSDVLAALDQITCKMIYTVISVTPPASSFRIEFALAAAKMNLKSDVLDVTKVTFYIEVGGATPDFKVGGTITMRLKVGGDATNYPLVSLGIEFQLTGLRLNLNGALSGEGDPQGCWRNSFSIKGLNICDVKVSVGLTAVAPWLQAFSFQGAIKIGDPTAPKYQIVVYIAVDLAAPTKNSFLGSYSGTLGIKDLVSMGLTMIGLGSTDLSAFPNIFTLNAIMVKVASEDITIAGETYKKGFAFKADFIIFGVAVKAALSISDKDISASFSSSRLAMLDPVLVLCKDASCNAADGPTFNFAVQWAKMPPTLLVQLDAYINILGLAASVHVYVTYSDWINFRAEFYLMKMSLVGGAFELSQADNVNTNTAAPNSKPSSVAIAPTGTYAGGPYAVFDSKALYIYLNCKITLLGFGQSVEVRLSKSDFYVSLATIYFGFPFSTTLQAGFASNGIPNSFTITLLAGSENTGLRENLRAKVYAKLDEMKKGGEGAINSAMADVDAQYAKFNNANAALQREKDKVAAEQARINGLCEEEEETSLELLETGMAAKKRGSRRLLAVKDSELSDASKEETKFEYKPRLVKGATVEELSDNVKLMETKQGAELKWGHRHHWHHGHHGHHWHHSHHSHHWHHNHHRWHVHIPHLHTAEMIKWAADQACAALKAGASGLLSIYQGLLTAAQGVVSAASHTLDVAKLFLQGVLAVQAGAFALMKAFATMALAVDYAKLEAQLSINILQSYIAASFRFVISGWTCAFSSSINLGDVLSVVTDMFNKAVAYLKSIFPIPSEEQLLQLPHDQLTSLLQPVDIATVQLIQAEVEVMDVDELHAQVERDHEIRAAAWDSLQQIGEQLRMAKENYNRAYSAYTAQVEARDAAKAKLDADRKAYFIQKALKNKKAYKAQQKPTKDRVSMVQENPNSAGEPTHTLKTPEEIVALAKEEEQRIKDAQAEFNKVLSAKTAADKEAAEAEQKLAAQDAVTNPEAAQVAADTAKQYDIKAKNDQDRTGELNEAVKAAGDA